MSRWMIMLPFICLCCALAASAGADQMVIGYQGNYGYEQGPGDGAPPGGGACDNAGVIYDDNPFSGWPLDYKPGDWSTITFYFCNRYPDGSPHWGVDFGIPDGSQILMTARRGIVRQAQTCDNKPTCWNYGMGRYVQVEAQIPVVEYDRCVSEHGGNPEADDCWSASGWLATYMHLQDVNVSEEQIVWRDDSLGRTDNTGNSTGSHLHYQINSPTDGAVDPAPTIGG